MNISINFNFKIKKQETLHRESTWREKHENDQHRKKGEAYFTSK